MHSAADHVASVTLELGGKSPVVVLADANMDDALEGVIKAIFANSGQVCSAGSRLIIECSCAEQFLEKLVARVRGFGFGGFAVSRFGGFKYPYRHYIKCNIR